MSKKKSYAVIPIENLCTEIMYIWYVFTSIKWFFKKVQNRYGIIPELCIFPDHEKSIKILKKHIHCKEITIDLCLLSTEVMYIW